MLNEPIGVWSSPLCGMTNDERRKFEDADMGNGWPEVSSRMLTRVLTGQDLDGAWVVVQPNVYRYAVAQDDGIMVRSVIREYLATEVRWE
jgi:hypothetical protein